MAVEAIGSVKIFFSYAQRDELLQKELENHLCPLKKRGLISPWHNRFLLAGKGRDSEITKHLNTAHLILLLISSDFLSSDSCRNVEAEAMRRHESGDARVIPIILRPVYWQGESFKSLTVLPTGGIPVKSWPNTDDAFLDITNNIDRVVRELLLDRCFNLIEKLCQENRHEEAFNIFEQAKDLTINNVDKASMNFLRGDILLYKKKYGEALTAYEAAAPHNSQNMDFFRNKGLVLQHLGRFEEAYEAYKKATDLGSQDPNLYNNMGDVLDHLKDEAYRKAKLYS